MGQLLIKNAMLDGKKVDILAENGVFTRIEADLATPQGAEVLDANDMAILPPFCNAHTHVPMTVLRGYADDMELFTWWRDYMLPAENQLTEDDIYAGSRLGILEMIKSGTLFFNEMYWIPRGIWRAAYDMGIRAEIGLQYFNDNGKILPRVTKENNDLFEAMSNNPSSRVRLSVAPHAIYSIPKNVLIQAREDMEKYHAHFHFHVSETQSEVDNCRKNTGKTPVEYLRDLDLVTPNSVFAHCVVVSDKDLEILAENRTLIAHNPVSNMKLCSGTFQFDKALKAGCRVAIGTDGCASNNNLSMLDEMKCAALVAKLSTMQPTAGKVSDVYRAATATGAEFFGIGSGKIAVGENADAILVNTELPFMVGDYNLISNLVYAADTSVVDSAICAGRVLMKHRVIEGEKEIIAAARKVCDKLRKLLKK